VSIVSVTSLSLLLHNMLLTSNLVKSLNLVVACKNQANQFGSSLSFRYCLSITTLTFGLTWS